MFQNGQATMLLKYVQSPDLKIIQGGKHLRQIILNIVEPPFFWVPFLASFRNGSLSTDAQQCFGWLLSELLLLPDKGASFLNVAHDPSIESAFKKSTSLDVRTVGQRVKHVASVFNSSNEDEEESGPGGRHDNDCTDFREIAIHPTADEILSEEPAFIRVAGRIDEPEASVTRLALHLDNQFRLLREDMLIEMREELQIVTGKKQGRHRGLSIDGLTPLNIDCGDHEERKPLPWGVQFRCTKDFPQLGKVKSKERRNYFSTNRNVLKHQSLACLIIDGMIASFPTIHRDLDQLAREPPVVTLQFSEKTSTIKSLLRMKNARHLRLVQINTAVFAFEPVLKGLQELRDMPLVDELLYWEPECPMSQPSHAPWKLIRTLEADPTQDLRHLLDLNNPVRLDESQLMSLLSGLKQRVSLIQGPPGRTARTQMPSSFF